MKMNMCKNALVWKTLPPLPLHDDIRLFVQPHIQPSVLVAFVAMVVAKVVPRVVCISPLHISD